jgi:hypothetical protein
MVDEMIDRWPSVRPFLLIGSLCTIVGGLVAAVLPTGSCSGPGPRRSWCWSAASRRSRSVPVRAGWRISPRLPAGCGRGRILELRCAATIVGTVTGMPIVTTAAGCARRGPRPVHRTTTAPNSTRRSARVIFRAVAGIVLVSIPIGLGLAWSRHP